MIYKNILFILFVCGGISLCAAHDDEDVLALRRLLSLYQQGEIHLTLEQGESFLQKFPQSKHSCYVLMVLGDVADQQNKDELARSYYEQLVGTPLEMQGERKIWDTLVRHEKWGELKARAIRKKNLSEEHLLTAAVFLAKEEPEAAAYLYKRVIEEKGEHVLQASIAYVQLQILLGRHAEGYQTLKKMSETNPEILSQPILITLITLAQTLKETNDISLWTNKYEELFGAETAPYQINLLLGQQALSSHDIPNYLHHFEEAWKKNPDLSKDENFHRQIFQGYYQLGKYAEAANHLKKVYEIHPHKLTEEEKLWLAEHQSDDKAADLITETLTKLSKDKELISSPEIEKALLIYFRHFPDGQNPHEDPLMSYLQQVAYCRVFDHEPNHLEAALDLVHDRYHGNAISQCNALLSFKEWFVFKGDIPSRDYHAAKESKKGGVLLFEGYMLLFDGELARLESEIAFQQGREREGRKKKEIAVKIYKNILNSSYGVTPYLLRKAKEGVMLLETPETRSDVTET